MRWIGLALTVVLFPPAVLAQDGYKVEALKEGPPAAFAGPIKDVLADRGYRILNDQGKPYAEIWFRKEIPASSKPAGPQGNILFPILAEGELLGVLRFAEEGQDYRDQAIPKGAYTLRYGLQPVNGDHLGVSPYRDYALLLPAEKDKAVARLPKKPLEEQSAEAAGTSHPAVLMMLASPDPAPSEPTMVHDEQKNTWGAVLPLTLAVKGGGRSSLQVQIIVSGAAMN